MLNKTGPSDKDIFCMLSLMLNFRGSFVGNFKIHKKKNEKTKTTQLGESKGQVSKTETVK